MNAILFPERMGQMLGVPGRFYGVVGEPDGKVFRNQKFVSESREFTERGTRYRMNVRIRFDDECNNGHDTFSITSETRRHERGAWREDGGGCQHELIMERFPEFAPLIKWHLTSTDGPMHYLANTLFHAGDRDHYGRRAGEPSRYETRLVFGANPIRHKVKSGFLKFLKENWNDVANCRVFEVAYKPSGSHDYKFGPKFTFSGYGVEWHDCPFETRDEAERFLQAFANCEPRVERYVVELSEGKKRSLEFARGSAVWPEASDEILCSEKDVLKAHLERRLPQLLQEFVLQMKSAGFHVKEKVEA